MIKNILTVVVFVLALIDTTGINAEEQPYQEGSNFITCNSYLFPENEEMFNFAVSQLKERSITHSECISISRIVALQMLDEVENKYRSKRHLTDRTSMKYSYKVAKAYKQERNYWRNRLQEIKAMEEPEN